MLTMQKMVSITTANRQGEQEDSADCFLGFDIGGTKIRGAIADRSGAILAETQVATFAHTSSAMDRVVDLAESLLEQANRPRGFLRAAAIGVPGVHDRLAGTIRDVPNVPELAELGALENLSRRLGVPIVVENDANLAALGEWVALGKPSGSLATIALGTGIGLGIVIDGTILRGDHGAAGEIAALPMGADMFERSFPDAVLESVVSTAGLLKLYTEAGGRAYAQSGADVFMAFRSGDSCAERALQRYGREVARAVLSIKAIIDPCAVVLTGGIGSDPFLRSLVAEFVGRAGAPSGLLVEGELGERAGTVGAVHLALNLALPSLA